MENGKPRERILRALDSELPLIATRAAIELDRMEAGQNIGTDSISKLAKMLSSATTISRIADKDYLLDPATMTLLGQAMLESELSQQPQMLSDLVSQAASIANMLTKQSASARDSSEIQKLKRFCLVLSELSASYRASVFGDEMQHPYRT